MGQQVTSTKGIPVGTDQTGTLIPNTIGSSTSSGSAGDIAVLSNSSNWITYPECVKHPSTGKWLCYSVEDLDAKVTEVSKFSQESGHEIGIRDGIGGTLIAEGAILLVTLLVMGVVDTLNRIKRLEARKR